MFAAQIGGDGHSWVTKKGRDFSWDHSGKRSGEQARNGPVSRTRVSWADGYP